MEMITNIVGKVDVLLAQVLIEGIVLEVEIGDSKNIGVSMVQNPNRFGRDFTGGGGFNNGQSFLNGITNFSSSLPAGFSYFGKIGSDLDVAVNAIATDRKANIMSRPRIQTSHAIPGEFTIAEIRPFVSGSYDYGGIYGGSVANRSIVERIPIGVQMYVTPFITPEGLVVMEISQNFDQFGGNVVIDNNPIPVVNNRAATATLTVRDGDTIMMGGFISQEKRRDKSGVPILKDIPGLGVLFRTKKDEAARKELIVLLKATVLKDPEDAAILASSERSQLPGVRQAEQEIQEEERKRLRKVKAPRK
jgi:general secretion pathway protein D